VPAPSGRPQGVGENGGASLVDPRLGAANARTSTLLAIGMLDGATRTVFKRYAA
jgi:hypothetical protein